MVSFLEKLKLVTLMFQHVSIYHCLFYVTSFIIIEIWVRGILVRESKREIVEVKRIRERLNMDDRVLSASKRSFKSAHASSLC